MLLCKVMNMLIDTNNNGVISMGQLKTLLINAIRENNKIDERSTDASRLYKKYKDEFTAKVGEPFLWKTSNNNDLKQPQLAEIVKAYDHYVLIQKIVMNVDQEVSYIRYAVNYNALYCGHDKLESLELI